MSPLSLSSYCGNLS